MKDGYVIVVITDGDGVVERGTATSEGPRKGKRVHSFRVRTESAADVLEKWISGFDGVRGCKAVRD